jgi:hypothetical protein
MMMMSILTQSGAYLTKNPNAAFFFREASVLAELPETVCHAHWLQN